MVQIQGQKPKGIIYLAKQAKQVIKALKSLYLASLNANNLVIFIILHHGKPGFKQTA